jgi:hypothetical protein
MHILQPRLVKIIILAAILISGVLLAVLFSGFFDDLLDPRGLAFAEWSQGDTQARQKLITVQREPCPGAPFILPADGFIGLLFGDPRGPYSRSTPHQGIDIFSNADAGVTPVYAAYDGYVTREADWKSTLIMRVPDDPLRPGMQVWLYYTHMADSEGHDFIVEAFPPGTSEIFIERGTLLGYTGNYNGNSLRGVWVHLHFSIVKDDGHGRYTNELQFENALDPTPYLGMDVNYACDLGIETCTRLPECYDQDAG